LELKCSLFSINPDYALEITNGNSSTLDYLRGPFNQLHRFLLMTILARTCHLFFYNSINLFGFVKRPNFLILVEFEVFLQKEIEPIFKTKALKIFYFA